MLAPMASVNWRPALLLLTLSGCSLLGVEPDEIDLADGTTSAMDSGAVTGMSAEAGGDGDGDPGGDAGTEGGNDDGEAETGMAESGCEALSAGELSEGDNAVTVADGPSLAAGSCGAPGPETIYTYVPSASATVSIALSEAEFEAVVWVSELSCEPLDELGCAPAPEAVELAVSEGVAVYVVVDSLAGTGAGTLSITPL